MTPAARDFDRSPRRSRLALVAVLAGLTMVGPFSIDTIFPAFPVMARDLGADRLAMQQTMSVYLITFAVASLFHGSLSDALGRWPVILAGTVLYAATSALAALAPTLSLLLGARALQGLVAGAGMIVGRTVIRDLFDGPQAQRFMSHVSMVFALAPAVAPIVGGWILGWSTWRSIFWVLAAYGVVLAVVTFVLLPETHPESDRVSFHPAPLLRTFWSAATDPAVLRLSATIGLNFAGLFLYISSAPAIVVDHLGLGPQDFGFLFAPLVVAMVVGSFLTGRLVGRVRAGVFVVTGFAISLAGAACAVGYNLVSDVPSLPWTIVPITASALGVALVFPILTITLLDSRPRERGTVSSFQAFLNTCGNAVVAGLVSPLVSHSMLVLGTVSGMFTALALALWAWHRHLIRRPTGAAELPEPASSAEGLERS